MATKKQTQLTVTCSNSNDLHSMIEWGLEQDYLTFEFTDEPDNELEPIYEWYCLWSGLNGGCKRKVRNQIKKLKYDTYVSVDEIPEW